MELSFPPDAVHTPGIAHVVADKPSRVFAPYGTGIVNENIHPALEQATETPALSETPNGTVLCSEPATDDGR